MKYVEYQKCVNHPQKRKKLLTVLLLVLLSCLVARLQLLPRNENHQICEMNYDWNMFQQLPFDMMMMMTKIPF